MPLRRRCTASGDITRKRLPEAEEATGVVSRLDAYQTVVVGPVVGMRPVLEVWVGEVLVYAPGPPRMHRRPRPRQPAPGGLPFGGGRVGVDDYRVLEQEELVAMDEGGGVGAHAVVRAAPRREVQLARLAWHPLLREMLYQHHYGFGGQRPPKELGLAVRVTLRRRLSP